MNNNNRNNNMSGDGGGPYYGSTDFISHGANDLATIDNTTMKITTATAASTEDGTYEIDLDYQLHQDDDVQGNENVARMLHAGQNERRQSENGAANDDDDDASASSSSSSATATTRTSMNDREGDGSMSFTELLYSFSSYHAIMIPVSVTMILAAFTTVYVNNAQTLAQGEAQMAQAYQVFAIQSSSSSSSSSAGKTLVLSLANALIMVLVICAMTFAIVLLYKFRCMTCLWGYMMFSSAVLLGFLGGLVWKTAIDIYAWNVDAFSFFGGLYNFAAVGIWAVFVAKGVPTFIGQSYLIATSVILAWQLAHFDSWTTWTLLIMLALYDLCAVLTPIGPLRALVNLMSRDDAPPMPGLLYEAQLPPEAQRPGHAPTTAATSGSITESSSVSSLSRRQLQNRQRQRQQQRLRQRRQTATDEENPRQEPLTRDHDSNRQDSFENYSHHDHDDNPIAKIPLAIAQVYNLPLVVDEDDDGGDNNNGQGWNRHLPNPLPPPEAQTPALLKTKVWVRLPLVGGRIDKRRHYHDYIETDRHGVPRRRLWVDRHGKVFCEVISSQQLQRDEDDDDDDDDDSSSSIRLGLGDFIFYSVLVAKAAQYSFTTFCACFLVILTGLGTTLILLAVYHHALPALPISIMGGVVVYLLVRTLVEPFLEQGILQQPYYV